jgi:hypothetical protein
LGRKTNKQRRAVQAQSAREKAAAARGQHQRAEQRRRAIVIISAVAAVAVVGAVIAAIAITRPSHTSAIANNRASAPTTVVDAVRNVPVSTLDAAGIGNAVGAPRPITGPALTDNGKPELLYIGAEFCPYCAGERWSMAVALSRFGTLDNIKLTQSASNDAYPNTATLDFIDATYSSKYLSFVPIENEDRDHKPLESVSSAQDALWAKYSTILKANGKGYPFLDFGNKYAFEGPTFVPQPLAHLTQEQIAAKLASPTDTAAKDINGSANLITAAICGMTNNQPSSVCTSKTISGIRTQIDKLATSAPGSSP